MTSIHSVCAASENSSSSDSIGMTYDYTSVLRSRSSKDNFFGEVRVSHRNVARQLLPANYSNMPKRTALTYKLRDLQKSGNIDGLESQLQRLQEARLMPHRQIKIDEVRSILDEPVTKIFDAIKNGNLKEAQAAIRRIFTLSPFKYKFGRFENHDLFEAKLLYYQQYYGYDVLYEAKKLYASREDASKIYEHNDSFPISFEDHRVYKSESSSSTQSQAPVKSISTIDVLPSQPFQQQMPLYQELYDNVAKNCAVLQDKMGFVTDYYQSRELALKQMISGDHAVYERTHNLSSQAQNILQSHGFDPVQFIQCKGNLLQQDTNAKLVQTLNDLAQKDVTTRTAQQIKEGVLECAQASSQFNQNGNVKEAVLLSDFCHVAVEYLWQGMSMGVEVCKGVADGLYVEARAEMRNILQTHPEVCLIAGEWTEPDLRTQVAMGTSALVSDLLKIIKDTGEVAFSGALGVGDAIVGLPELVTNCFEVTKLTVECLAPLAKETLYLMDAAERKNVGDFQKYLANVQYEYGRLSQGVSTFMGQLKDQKSCVNGQITKAHAKYWARSGARMLTEYIMLKQALKGASKVMKGVSTYLKSTEAALGEMQGMKEVSRAQVRNILLAAQLEGSEPLVQMSSLSGKSAAVEQVMVPTALAAEARISSVAPIMEKSIAESIIQQGEALSSSSLTQKVGQYLSLEPKPGYILIEDR